jgi:hypothetical protein
MKEPPTSTLVIGFLALTLVGVLFTVVLNQRAPVAVAPPIPAGPRAPSAFAETDWHAAGPDLQVRWINDDAFTHVGGHCYGRKTDGSTRDAAGHPGYAPLAEKFCIAFGAKDTPFDVPDKR